MKSEIHLVTFTQVQLSKSLIHSVALISLSISRLYLSPSLSLYTPLSPLSLYPSLSLALSVSHSFTLNYVLLLFVILKKFSFPDSQERRRLTTIFRMFCYGREKFQLFASYIFISNCFQLELRKQLRLSFSFKKSKILLVFLRSLMLTNYYITLKKQWFSIFGDPY